MSTLTADGHAIRFAPGATLLDTLTAAGISVPHLCHDARLAPQGACRLCLVDIDGQPRPVASCSLPASEGMVVHTRSARLEMLCLTNLQLIADHYPAQALADTPEHPFHRLLAEHGVAARGTSSSSRFVDDTHPYLGLDMDRCVHCNRCVRICEDVQGQFVWQTWQRGEHTRIAPAHGVTLLDSGCVSCGACADTCPTGAIFDKRSPQPATNWTRTTCVYCGVGCQMEVGTRDGRVVQVRPADSPVNRGHLCVKGRYAWEFGTASDRITTPMIRDQGQWREVSWDAALDHVASRLAAIREQAGPDSIGVLGSARATNEENYLAQKFARVVIGTNNVDCCARVCHAPSAKALKAMLGTGAATSSFDDIEQAQLIMLCGCNPTENHPIVGARIKQAVRQGAKLIVIDPRRIDLAQYADLHLAPRPGTNLPLFNAMAACIVEEGLVDPAFLRERVTDFEAFAAFIGAYAPERAAGECGVAAADIRRAARLYAGSGASICFHGLGMTEHVQGTEGVMTLINLALLTGNLGRPGTGINPLRGQNNVQGSATMGCEPSSLTGSQSIPQARARFEAVWGAPVPEAHGLDLMQMIDAAAAGRLHALWVMGYDVYLTLANAGSAAQALGRLDLVVVQDLFLNETAKAFGTVFLPVASFLERDGTFMNSDRRVQHIRKAVEPPGNARPEWWIIQEVARRMGHQQGFAFGSAEGIWDEVRALWPAGAGLTYTRLERESLHWPCPDERHPGTPSLHAKSFAGSRTAALKCIDFAPTRERCDPDFPLLLNTGRRLYHFNAGTMTYRTPNARLEASDTLDISPTDAAHLGIGDGEIVRIVSRHGSAELPVRITATVKPGELFASFHRPDIFLNRVTSGERDRMVHSPEYKVTAVRVEVLGPAQPQPVA